MDLLCRTPFSRIKGMHLKVPRLQTILLTVLLLGAVTAIVWISIVVQGEMPRPPASETEVKEGPAAWLGAWSMFWGAVAGGIGAVGTAGALLLGVRIYYLQEKDRRRAQAVAVTVGTKLDPIPHSLGKQRVCYIRNDSPLPIYNVSLYAGRAPYARAIDPAVIATGGEETLALRHEYETVHAKFVDSAGVAWKRGGDGHLAEITNPDDGEPWEMD